MQKYGDWEPLMPPLGEGGQSVVYRARTPERCVERQKFRRIMMEFSGQGFNEQRADDFATASYGYAREESPSEFGALKVFDKIREGGAPAQERLKREVEVLSQKRHGLPKLLDAKVEDRWMVTEYFPNGTIAKSPLKFQGKPVPALRAFRTLVETVASLHQDQIIHRDIKPDNVFYGSDGSLVLGDFGIVFMHGDATRPTVTQERVGPRDYMPQWADLGERLADVHPNFDVYMLGKLLWCMVAGRLRLPREYHRRRGFNLEEIFPQNPRVRLINSILDKCLVEDPDRCLASAKQLLEIVDTTLANVNQGVPMLDEKGNPILPCLVCGKGVYRELRSELRLSGVDEKNMPITGYTRLRIFACNVCTHYAFFAPGNPQESAKRGWTPWQP
jgi:serine/threonine protein kinase